MGGVMLVMPTESWHSHDNFVATVRYAVGSVRSLTDTALCDKAHPKESMDICADGRVLSLDDHKSLGVAAGATRRTVWHGAEGAV